MRRVTIAAALITSGLLAGACGTAHGLGPASSPHGVLTIANAGNSPWTCGFNPFNGSASSLSLGPVYEPLAFVNALRSGKATPWLATSWRWGPENRSLTFTIRKGVTFSDGTPMTADDVAFSFDLIRRHPALDLYGVWSVLSGVRKAGGGRVLMTFKRAAVPYFYYIADDVPVVPRHIWSKITRPAAYADAHPVGTGAFLVSSCTPKDITYTASRRYWRPGEPHVAKVVYPSFEANDPANTMLAAGSSSPMAPRPAVPPPTTSCGSGCTPAPRPRWASPPPPTSSAIATRRPTGCSPPMRPRPAPRPSTSSSPSWSGTCSRPCRSSR